MAADLSLSSLTPLWTVKQCKQTQLKLSSFCATLSIIVLSQVSHKHPPSSEGTDYVMQQLLTRELLHFSKENCSAQLSSGLLLCGNEELNLVYILCNCFLNGHVCAVLC